VIWATWRQQRTETLIAVLLLALLAALLVPTGLHMASVYDGDGIAACLTDSSSSCRDKLDAFAGRWNTLEYFVGWFILVPALIGVLLAAPFALEFERGTFRLAWTQSVTRNRWLAVRMAAIVVAAIGASVAFTLLMTWWRAPLDDIDGRFQDAFDYEGVVPAAYTLFAAALVIAFGVVLRRTAAAIGLALVTFIVVRIAIGNWGRPNYLSPVEETRRGDFGADFHHGAWVFSQGGEFRVVNGAAPDPAVLASCVSDPATKRFDETCLAQHDIVFFSHATYHPADRFWAIQAIEASIYVGMTLALLAFAVWWIRKRMS
jgi:hypothetical protein